METAREFCDKLTGLMKKKPRPGQFLDANEFESPEMLAWKKSLIAPNGPRKARWDWFVLLLVFYTSISVPFQLSFYAFTNPENNMAFFVLDILIDLCFIVDVGVSWRTSYYDREGVLVTDYVLVRKQYLKFWFWIDIFASFPFQYVGDLILIGSDDTTPAAFKIPSLVKLLRVLRLGKKIDRLSSSKMFRIAQFTFILLMAAHWYACFWFYLGNVAAPGAGGVDDLPGADGTSWVYRLDLKNESRTMRYTAALYWAVTTLMKSPWFHPNAPEEFVGATIMIIIGCVLFAYFLGNVTAVITAANAAGGRYRGQIEQLKSFCASEGISKKMSDKLLVYQDALWTETANGTDRTAMINSMPRHLLPYVLIGHIYRPLMDACPFLYDCSAWGAVEFLRALKVQVCERGDTLIRSGTLVSSMYILVRGEVKVQLADDPIEKETAEIYVQGGRIGSKKSTDDKRKTASAKDAMRGRTDKFGTLLGFNDPLKPNTPREYTVDALSRLSLLMMTRAQLKDCLTTFVDDKAHILKAIEMANEQHKVGGRRVSRQSVRADSAPPGTPKSITDSQKVIAAGEDSKSFLKGAHALEAATGSTPAPSANVLTGIPEGGAGLSQRSMKQRQQSSGGGFIGNFLSPSTSDNSEVRELRQEVTALRAEMRTQQEKLDGQTKMLEQILANTKMSA